MRLGSLFLITLVALLAFGPAAANEKHPPPKQDPTPAGPTSSAGASASAAAAAAARSSSAATGGNAAAEGGNAAATAAGGAGGAASATGAGDSAASSSTTVSHRAAVLTMSTAEAVRIAPECWRPADRFGRPISTPLFALGGRVVRDDECWAEYLKGREHDRKMDELRLEIERDNAHAARDVAASQRVQAEQERERWVRK